MAWANSARAAVNAAMDTGGSSSHSVRPYGIAESRNGVQHFWGQSQRE